MKSDEEIVELLLRKEEAGLAELVDKYAPLLKSVVRKHLYALPGHQEECLNDVLLAIWDHAAQYDPMKASFKNWICAIARYRSINLLKKYRHNLSQANWDETQNQEQAVEDKPFARELWEIQLAELLAPLSKKDQQLFKDVFDSNFSTQEVAVKHRLTPGALYNRISRGKVKIREFFQKKGAVKYEE